jgi:hypothetical protein
MDNDTSCGNQEFHDDEYGNGYSVLFLHYANPKY